MLDKCRLDAPPQAHQQHHVYELRERGADLRLAIEGTRKTWPS